MTCKEMILSDDYVDLLTDFEQIGQIVEAGGLDACYHAIDAGYGVTHIKSSQTPPMSIGYYGYSSIPKLYGLMQVEGRVFDSSPLVAMGNIRVQNPPLALQGNGVIIGFIDTGEHVIILPIAAAAARACRRGAIDFHAWCSVTKRRINV